MIIANFYYAIRFDIFKNVYIFDYMRKWIYFELYAKTHIFWIICKIAYKLCNPAEMASALLLNKFQYSLPVFHLQFDEINTRCKNI